MSAVIATKSASATIEPAGRTAFMLDGQSTDGSANQARNEMSPSHGDPTSAVLNDELARPKAVSHTIPTVR